MKYILYCTVNTVNGKIYVGIHKTFTPEKFDGYLGCGVYTDGSGMQNRTAFQKAVKKHGTDKFRRVTIDIFDTEYEALLAEAKIVTIGFVKRLDTYNTTVGGKIKSYKAPIAKYGTNGKLLTVYDSIDEAAKEAKVLPVSIYKASLKHNVTLNGYFWRAPGADTIKVPETYKELSKKGRPIIQYSKAGYKMKRWNSAKDAAHHLHVDRATITAACRGKKKTVKGYQWRYESDGIDNLPPVVTFGGSPKSVIQLTKNGVFIKTYNSVTEAALENDVQRPTLQKALKKGTMLAGYYWKYV